MFLHHKSATTDYPNPDHWLEIRTVEMHTGGEPLRVILSGWPELSGASVLERRRQQMEHFDHLRKALMWEPRGHADMYGCLIVPPNDAGADFGIIFMHNEGYSTMCGHATIAITRLAVELHWVEIQEPETRVVIDAPCGRLVSYASIRDGKVLSVRFEGVPSFVLARDQMLQVPGLGSIIFDLAYGGAFYAFVQIEEDRLPLTPEYYQQHIHYGRMIKQLVQAGSWDIRHPFEHDLSFLYGTIFMQGPVGPGAVSRNVCVFADGEVDRSPTGSGVSCRMALHYDQGLLQVGDTMTIESIVGSAFTGKVLCTTNYGPYEAVIPEVGGMAYVTGENRFWIDSDDPFREGFFLR